MFQDGNGRLIEELEEAVVWQGPVKWFWDFVEF